MPLLAVARQRTMYKNGAAASFREPKTICTDYAQLLVDIANY
jgi:hypothetical protein